MTLTEEIKRYVLDNCGMDAVGVARADALDDERGGHRPEDLLPGAKSVIVFLKRIPDGIWQAAFRAREDGNADARSIYAAFGRELTPNLNLFFMSFNLAQYIERTYAFPAVPVPAGEMQNVTPTNTPLPAFVGAKHVQYVLHPARAAVAAGLGEIAWNNSFVTAENGPRQGIGLVVTTMDLDCDAPYAGPRLCRPEECGVCARICPTHAIPAPGGESEAFEVGGTAYRTACINANACAVASMAFRREFAGKADVPDQILCDAPDDETLKKAYQEKPPAYWSLGHHPDYYCDLCKLYCPLGNWQARFGDAGLSGFDGKAAVK